MDTTKHHTVAHIPHDTRVPYQTVPYTTDREYIINHTGENAPHDWVQYMAFMSHGVPELTPPGQSAPPVPPRERLVALFITDCLERGVLSELVNGVVIIHTNRYTM